jgi:3-deoxy-manno-octulosonate cytidylyltransferase (CMP-KDO synthetase)
MSFTIIIPARMASTRLPDKPLADLGGKPMIVRVAQRAAMSRASRIVVATDHANIFAACKSHDIAVHMTRSDHPSGTDRIAEVATALALADDQVIVNVQGDEPLIDPELINECASLITEQVPMATAAHPIAVFSCTYSLASRCFCGERYKRSTRRLRATQTYRFICVSTRFPRSLFIIA